MSEMTLDYAYFPTVEGSLTSDDGQTFYLCVRRDGGNEVMLGFPHNQIPSIVECAAVQADKGRDILGTGLPGVFAATKIELRPGHSDNTVLTLTVGEETKISFLLGPELPAQLRGALQRMTN